MAYIKLTHPFGSTGDKLYDQHAVHGGPTLDVWFTLDGVIDAEYLAGVAPGLADVGKYVNLAWRFFGPDGPERELSDSGGVPPDGTLANPKTFEAPTPGRYLVRLTARVLEIQNGTVGPSATDSHFSAFVEIEDPNIIGNADGGHLEYAPGSRGSSYIAPTEADEFDPDEGWARSAERYFASISKQLGNRRMVTLKTQQEVFQGDILTLQVGAYEKWKSSIVGTDPGGVESYYYNYVLDARKLTIGEVQSDLVLEAPLFVVMQHAGAGDRVNALAEGTLPFDTTGWAADDRVYVSAASALTNTQPSTVDVNNRDRLIGHTVAAGTDSANPPGSIYFHGTIPWLPTVVTGPLASTDDAIVRWDGTTGDKIKDSRVVLKQDEGSSSAYVRTSTDGWSLEITTGEAAPGATSNPGSMDISPGMRLDGDGASLNIASGSTAANGNGGTVQITGGGTTNGDGGAAGIAGGSGQDGGGEALITGGTGTVAGAGSGGAVRIAGGGADNAAGLGGNVSIDGGVASNGNGGVLLGTNVDATTEVGAPAHTLAHTLLVHKGIKVLNQTQSKILIESTASFTQFSMVSTTSGNVDSDCDVLFGDDVNPGAGGIKYDMSTAAAHGADKMSFSVWNVPTLTSFPILTLVTTPDKKAFVDGILEVSGDGIFCGGAVKLYGVPYTGWSPVDAASFVNNMVAHFDGDIDVTGNIDPTGIVFSEQDPATPPYDPTGGNATKGLLYTATGQGGNANTLRYIDNQGVEIIMGQSEIGSPSPDANGVISTDRAIAAWDGNQGDLLRNTNILVSDINGGPSLSTNSLDTVLNVNNIDITEDLLVSTGEGINLGQGLPMATGNLMLHAGHAFAQGVAYAEGGGVIIRAGSGIGPQYGNPNANDDGSGGDVELTAGGATNQYMTAGSIRSAAGNHLGGIPSTAGNIDEPHLDTLGDSRGGQNLIAGGLGNSGGLVFVQGGHSSDITNPGAPGVGDGGDITLIGGLSGLWQLDNGEVTATPRGGALGGTVNIHGGNSPISRNVNGAAGTEGQYWVRDGGSGGAVKITGGNAGYGTGLSGMNAIDTTGDGVIDMTTSHGHGGDVTISGGAGDHFGDAGDVVIQTQHTNPGDFVTPYAGPQGFTVGQQGFGKPGDIKISAASTIPDVAHRKQPGNVFITAGLAGTATNSGNMEGDASYNATLQAGTNQPQQVIGTPGSAVVAAPGQPDWEQSGVLTGPDASIPWPTQGPNDNFPGELLTPWPSIVSFDPHQRGSVVIGSGGFNGLTDNPTVPGVVNPTTGQNINGSMMCNGRVPRLVVEGSAKIRGGVDPTYVSFESFAQHPMEVEMAEIYDGEDLAAMLSAYRTLRDKTLWVHSDWQGFGPTLMLGDGPIQGGGGNGGHTTNNYLVGGGNLKHLGEIQPSGPSGGPGYVVASDAVPRRLHSEGGGPIEIKVNPTVQDSKILLRFNSLITFRNADASGGQNTTRVMFARQNVDKTWARLTPSGEELGPTDSPEWASTGGWNLQDDLFNVTENSKEGSRGSMQSCSWVDEKRPSGLEEIVYSVWAASETGDGTVAYGENGIPITFEVIEILEGEESETVDIPTYDPEEPPTVGEIPAAAMADASGGVTLSASTIEAVASRTKSGQLSATGIRTTGAVYTHVSTLSAENMTEDWAEDSKHIGLYSVAPTDHVIGMNSASYGGEGVGKTLVIDLPTPTQEESGRTYVLKDSQGRARIWARAANATDPNEKNIWSIDGNRESLVNEVPRGSITIYCDGENYYVV
jgi:hypothetical protein